MSSLPNRRKQEESRLLYFLVLEEIPWQVLYPNNSEERPLYFVEKAESSVYLSVGKKKTPVSLSQGRELRTISSSSSRHGGRELTIKKKGGSSSKLQTLTIEVWSCVRLATGKKTRAPSQNGIHEKEEGSDNPSVGKKRPLFSLGKGNKRVPDYLLFLSRRRKRACQSSLNFQQEKLCTSSRPELRASSNLLRQNRRDLHLKNNADRPLQDIEKPEILFR